MHVTDSRAQFVRGDAMRLPFPDGGRRWRTAASSLLLTGRRRDGPHPAPWRHAPRVPLGLHPGRHGTHPLLLGTAVSLDEGSRELDEFLRAAGLADVEVDEINIATRFRNFDDYGAPFLGGQGHAPSLASLSQKGGRSSVWWAPLRLRASRPLRGGGWQATAGRPRHRTRPHRCSAATGGSGLSATAGVCSCADSTEARPSTAPAAPGADPIRQQDRARECAVSQLVRRPQNARHPAPGRNG